MKNLAKVGAILGVFLLCLILVPQIMAAGPKTITGQVLTSGGSPVNDATVTATLSSDTGNVETTTTDGSGNYSMSVASGNYSVTVGPTNYTTTWNYFGAPQIVTFTADSSAESRTKNFTVISTDATITGTLQNSGSSASPTTGAIIVTAEYKQI